MTGRDKGQELIWGGGIKTGAFSFKMEFWSLIMAGGNPEFERWFRAEQSLMHSYEIDHSFVMNKKAFSLGRCMLSVTFTKTARL